MTLGLILGESNSFQGNEGTTRFQGNRDHKNLILPYKQTKKKKGFQNTKLTKG